MTFQDPKPDPKKGKKANSVDWSKYEKVKEEGTQQSTGSGVDWSKFEKVEDPKGEKKNKVPSGNDLPLTGLTSSPAANYKELAKQRELKISSYNTRSQELEKMKAEILESQYYQEASTVLLSYNSNIKPSTQDEDNEVSLPVFVGVGTGNNKLHSELITT
jgi:hypothetical protein